MSLFELIIQDELKSSATDRKMTAEIDLGCIDALQDCRLHYILKALKLRRVGTSKFILKINSNK